MPIKPKTDNKPGQKSPGRFSGIIENVVPEVIQVPEPKEVILKKSEPTKSTVRTFTEGQPIRLDRALWLRLKMLKLQQEGRGVKVTLMELLDTAVEEYLKRNES